MDLDEAFTAQIYINCIKGTEFIFGFIKKVILSMKKDVGALSVVVDTLLGFFLHKNQSAVVEASNRIGRSLQQHPAHTPLITNKME